MWALSFLPNLKIIGLRTSSYESLDFLLMLWVTVFWSPDLLPLIYNNSSLSAQLDVNSPSTRRESQSEASVWQIDSKINHGLVSFSPKFEEFDDAAKDPEMGRFGIGWIGRIRSHKDLQQVWNSFCFRRSAQFYGICYKKSLSTIKEKAGSNLWNDPKSFLQLEGGSSGKREARNS